MELLSQEVGQTIDFCRLPFLASASGELQCNYTPMRANLIRIGNSRGIRIPKPLLEQAGLRDTVQLRVEKGRLVILPDRKPRQGWSESFAAMAAQGDDRPLLGDALNAFDHEEWIW